MTQTLPDLEQCPGICETALARFRESLSRKDQQTLDTLFENAKEACLSVTQQTPALPLELFLIALLLEQQKTLQFLVSRLNYYDQKLYLRRVKNVRCATETPSDRQPV